MPHPIINRRITLTASRSLSVPFVGALDVLIAQGAVVERAYSVRQLRSAYAGQCAMLRGNGTGSPEADIPFTAGALDTSAAAAVIANGGGTNAYWKTLYDQSVNAAHATQNTAANQVLYGTTIFPMGALGKTSQSNSWLDFSLSALNAPFAAWVVFNRVPIALRKSLVGAANSTTSGLSATTNSGNLCHDWGVDYISASLVGGKTNVLSVCNGVTSKLYRNGSLVATANAGTTAGAGTWRIGAGMTPTSSCWFQALGSHITEVIIFRGDPTLLAGWADFVAAAKSYFGTA